MLLFLVNSSNFQVHTRYAALFMQSFNSANNHKEIKLFQDSVSNYPIQNVINYFNAQGNITVENMSNQHMHSILTVIRQSMVLANLGTRSDIIKDLVKNDSPYEMMNVHFNATKPFSANLSIDLRNMECISHSRTWIDVRLPPKDVCTVVSRVRRVGEPCGWGFTHSDLLER